MKKQINEFKRMQLIAGLITESEYRESKMDEAEDNSFQKPEEDSNIETLKKRYKFSKDLETIASKQNPKLFKIFEPGFNADEIQLGDYIQFFPNEKPDLVFAADEKSVNASHDNAEDSKYNRSLLKKINRERVSKLK
jgi:hypothetical protein